MSVATREIIRKAEVLKRTQLSASSVDRLEADGKFPQRLQLSPYTVGWLNSEVENWIDERVRAREHEPRIGTGRASKRHPHEVGAGA